MGNVVVNTIVRMLTRKTAGKAMRSVQKAMGAKKGQASGRHKKKGNAKGKKAVD